MKLSIEIPDNKVSNFSDSAKKELRAQTRKISIGIADESCRLEAGRRSVGSKSEVTQSIVREVATKNMMMFAKRSSWRSKIIQIIAFISTSFAGALFDIDKFQETNRVIWFIICFFIAITSTVILIFKFDNNG